MVFPAIGTNSRISFERTRGTTPFHRLAGKLIVLHTGKTKRGHFDQILRVIWTSLFLGGRSLLAQGTYKLTRSGKPLKRFLGHGSLDGL
jgi:hypothetical protein